MRQKLYRALDIFIDKQNRQEHEIIELTESEILAFAALLLDEKEKVSIDDVMLLSRYLKDWIIQYNQALTNIQNEGLAICKIFSLKFSVEEKEPQA